MEMEAIQADDGYKCSVRLLWRQKKKNNSQQEAKKLKKNEKTNFSDPIFFLDVFFSGRRGNFIYLFLLFLKTCFFRFTPKTAALYIYIYIYT